LKHKIYSHLVTKKRKNTNNNKNKIIYTK
jgi:hypothetical protein